MTHCASGLVKCGNQQQSALEQMLKRNVCAGIEAPVSEFPGPV